METGHVGINVTNLEQSKRFYAEVFGFQTMHESTHEASRFLFLGDGNRIQLTLWEQSQGRFAKRLPGLHHLSFCVSGPEEIQRIEQQLKARNATIYYGGIVPHGVGAESGGIFFEDPDGTRLEVFTEKVSTIQTSVAPAAPACGFF